MLLIRWCLACLLCLIGVGASGGVGLASDDQSAEAAVRALVRANAEKDIRTLSQMMAHDADVTSYTIGGRKYVGWTSFQHDMEEEFQSAHTIEIPIRELKVWTKGDFAWYAMEIDYIRTVKSGNDSHRALLPLRETGVLERRNGQWVLHSWHESFRNAGGALTLNTERPSPPFASTASAATEAVPDLSGEWEILEVEDDKRYRATLDKTGNGPYTQHGGRFVTTQFANRLWQGTWQQPGNDREGGFEILLSEDGKEAKGVWWYTRVGNHKNIPPREHGGTYQWKRISPVPAAP
ncbi:MAG TPA: nuclear transport factor 2 family protein [Nitrospira sp.]|jgi:ketosteroid isomerase-like protein|nr:nuclear transport factor 2 family protein [Nitrospira sp.]